LESIFSQYLRFSSHSMSLLFFMMVSSWFFGGHHAMIF
jgi:hypothetical protein